MNTVITTNSILQPTACSIVRPQKEGYLFYNSHTDELHLVSSDGLVVYELCNGLRTVGEIQHWLSEAIYDEREIAQKRIEQFIESLVVRGLLEVIENEG